MGNGFPKSYLLLFIGINVRRETFLLQVFEPVKIKNELYGKSISINHPKKSIKFSSAFHSPTYIRYEDIEEITISYDRKIILLVLGFLTFFAFIGIFILFFRTHLPPWHIKIAIKDQIKPISIRARMKDEEAAALADFCTLKIPTKLLVHEKKARKMAK
ncbi:hypothetical protein WKT22_02648 [Candidatus Lokiarchaeum ossiferum]